jgi:GDP-L-fucose synthase
MVSKEDPLCLILIVSIISIKKLAEMIKEIIGFKGTLYFNTDKPDGTMKKPTDVSKLQNLGWRHSIELREGIIYIYEWYISRDK